MTVSIELINQAVTIRDKNMQHINDTAQFYLQKLSDIRKETDSVISTNTVFIIVMTVCAIVFLCCIFKLCFTSTHTKKPTFRSYRLKEWTRQVHHYHQINEPNNGNIIRTQARKPNPEDIELQATLQQKPPQFTRVSY